MTRKNKQNRFSPTQILVLGFACTILVGAFLLNLPVASRNGRSMGIINALFESTSAVCVTGLVVVDTGTDLSLFGQLVIMVLIQTGGLGFMTMATMVFLLLGKRITLRERLVMQEALNQSILQGIVRLTRNVLLVTFLIEGIGALLLSTRFIPIYGLKKGLYFSVFHAISAFCNAGFDLIGGYQSFTGFTNDFIINVTLMGLIILGGLGFSVLLDIFQKKEFSRCSLHTKMVVSVTGILILIGFIFFFIAEYNNTDTLGKLTLPKKILAALFQSITPRTAGFSTIDTSSLTTLSKFMTIILMFIGASPASTGGGIKTVTASIIIMTVISVIRGREDIEVFKKRIPYSTAHRALAIGLISLTVQLCVTMVLSAVETLDFIDIFFEVTSALGTVGLSTIDTGSLKNISKVFLIFTMFIGRVGPLTLALAFARRQSRKKVLIRYPEEQVMVG